MVCSPLMQYNLIKRSIDQSLAALMRARDKFKETNGVLTLLSQLGRSTLPLASLYFLGLDGKLFQLQNRKAYGRRPMYAQCVLLSQIGVYQEEVHILNRISSVTVSNKRVPLLATLVGGEEIRLTRVFSVLRLHMPSCFATRIMKFVV